MSKNRYQLPTCKNGHSKTPPFSFQRRCCFSSAAGPGSCGSGKCDRSQGGYPDISNHDFLCNSKSMKKWKPPVEGIYIYMCIYSLFVSSF